MKNVVIYNSFWYIRVELDGSAIWDDLDTSAWEYSKGVTKEVIQQKVDKLKKAYDAIKLL